ncbi:MAG: protein translocase subunit SecF [Oscillospiraceae bacterium]
MKKLNIDFYGKRKIFFSISAVLFAIIAAVAIFAGVLLDISFKGGTIISYEYDTSIDLDELQKTVEDTIGESVFIQTKKGLNGQDTFDISLANDEGLNADKQSELAKKLEDKYGDKIAAGESKSVDATIGNEFFQKSLLAIAFAALLLIIYVAIRFRKIGGWSAGVTGVAALAHDVIIVFGTFVILRIPLDYNFIAVVLTILGYSINDTIVIYDRVRENEHIYGKSMPIAQLVNNSINETLGRTINTSIATFISMAVVSIVAMIMGVQSILNFSVPMAIGMISGTYSTIFIAGPLWVMWQQFKEKRSKNKGKAKK